MSQELIGEASSVETRNKKKKENLTGKGIKWKVTYYVKLWTVIFFDSEENIWEGKETSPPPSNYSTLLINPRILCLKVAVIAPHMQTFQSSEKS